MKYYDSHCHLNSQKMYNDWEEYLKRFMKIGGAGIINSGADLFYNIKTIEISKICKEKYGLDLIVKSTLGRHPGEISFVDEKERIKDESDISIKMDWLKDMIMQNKEYLVGIGECGIDLHYENTPEILDLQKKLFIRHCELARELNLPLIVHSRDGWDQTVDVLKDYRDLVVYFHCRGYGPIELQTLKDLGFKKLFVGICGNVTYKKTEDLFSSLKLIPLDCLLLETDSPYLTPQIVRGVGNEPSFVSYIYDFVAENLGIEKEQLAAQIERNFNRLLEG